MYRYVEARPSKLTPPPVLYPIVYVSKLMAVFEQVAIALDPPIRKGQTYYHHVLVQFSKDEDISVALDIGDELLAAKNEKVCTHPGPC